jgi:N-acetylglutamate synthase-like GNAT family acetyltransferase
MIRPLNSHEAGIALEIINTAALAYRGVIPADCWQEPYIPLEELLSEMESSGVKFWAYETQGRLAGVMGRQKVRDVTLIRHAYVSPDVQRAGIGAQLLHRLRQGVSSPMLVGTWAAAWWAIRFYEKHGFRLVTPEDKDRLLRAYWTISDRQIETSVVLADDRWFASRPEVAG